MNTSKHINPKVCRTCGLCCKYFTIIYPKKGCHPLTLSEVDRFRLLDDNTVDVREDKECFYVTFHHWCSKLRQEGNHYTCSIYDSPERPLLCQEYPFENATDCPHKLYIPKEVKQL